MSRSTIDAANPSRWTALGGWAGLAVLTAVGASIFAGALADAALPVVLGTSTTRTGMALSGVACVGLALVGVLISADASETARVRRALDRAIAATAGLWLALVALGIWFRAADAFAVPPTQVAARQLLRWTTELAAGRGMLLTGGCAAFVFGCAVTRLRDPERVSLRAPLIGALLGVLTPAVTGHAGSSPDHQLAVVGIALHTGSAALWTGGLAALLLFVAPRPALLDSAVPRFSKLAGGCVAVVAITGVLSAALRLESWAALVTTGYGALVLAKAACLVVLAALGGLARRRLLTGRIPVLRWAGWEVAVMAVTLGVAAALSQTA